MMQNTDYQNFINEILFYFSEKIKLARSYKINDLIIDPGFGFAKNTNQNFELLQKMELLKMCELPILAGISRKSMIYKTLDTTPEFALNGTTALNMIALQNGANILRVHDVKEAKECVTLYNKLQKYA
jgi:dihydropteroate synthase